MKKQYLFTIVCFLTLLFHTPYSLSQSAGDLAFVGFNTDGDRDFALVVLKALPANSTIYITDDETNGVGTPSALVGSEGTLTWNTGGSSIAPGTVVIFTDTDNSSNPNFGASIGTLSRSGAFTISGSKDGLIAFVGSDENTPTTFIAALQIGNDSSVLGPFDGNGTTLSNTGLDTQSTIVVIDTAASPDGGIYSGSRTSESSFSDYRSLISDDSNWTTVGSSGDGESLLPFSSNSFTSISTTWLGGTNTSWSETTNWSDGVPHNTSNVTISDTNNAPILESSLAIRLNNLIINEPDGLNIENGAILIVDGTSSGKMNYNHTLSTDSWYLMSSPVNGVSFNDNFVSVNDIASGQQDNRGIGIYNSANNSWDYLQAGGNVSLNDGVGFSVKRNTAGNLSLSGTIHHDNDGVNVTLSNEGSRFNLLGNPYTSYINSVTFLQNEIAISETKTLWVWNPALGLNGSYEVKGVEDNLYLDPGQGFFVKANSAGGTFNFSKSNQNLTKAASKTSKQQTEIKLWIEQGDIKNYCLIRLHESGTQGFDIGRDGELFSSSNAGLNIFSKLPINDVGKPYQLQSLPRRIEDELVIPLGINADPNKELRIKIESRNLSKDLKLYVEDRLKNRIVAITENNRELKILDENKTISNRIYLHIRPKALHIETNPLQDLVVYQKNPGELYIKGITNEKVSIKLYNAIGQLVFKNSLFSKGNSPINIPKLPIGIYIINLQTNRGNLSKKIILK
ncbi:MAG: hypothetical protein CMB99_04570 [Flavobacteriaceae bacterium]|nr:hypothetical protein [Flavobacteriaceae bacterium]|tara:strand:+ start:20539 stop:22746 length:2208 start_codon:yes stop_codon:yes gene_type:complete